MTLSIDRNKSNTVPLHQNAPKTQVLDVEVIRALTPLFIALIGGVIGMTLILLPLFLSTEKSNNSIDNNAAFGLASSAIAGAAGLAQSHKDKEKE